MDYLIKKSDGTAVSQGGTVAKVKLPNQTGGDVTFVGDKRPVDLGNYILVEANEVTESLHSMTQKRGKTTVVVNIDAQTVTVTHTAILKTKEDLINEFNNKRVNEYGSIQDQLDMQYWDKINGTNNWEKHITSVKKNNPKS